MTRDRTNTSEPASRSPLEPRLQGEVSPSLRPASPFSATPSHAVDLVDGLRAVARNWPSSSTTPWFIGPHPDELCSSTRPQFWGRVPVSCMCANHRECGSDEVFSTTLLTRPDAEAIRKFHRLRRGRRRPKVSDGGEGFPPVFCSERGDREAGSDVFCASFIIIHHSSFIIHHSSFIIHHPHHRHRHRRRHRRHRHRRRHRHHRRRRLLTASRSGHRSMV